MNSNIKRLKDNIETIESYHKELHDTLYETLEENTRLKLELEKLEGDKGIADMLRKAFDLKFKLASVDKHGQAFVIAETLQELKEWG